MCNCGNKRFFRANNNNKSKEKGSLPVIGVIPGILGTLKALKVIKTILDLPNLENKLLMVNLIDLRFNVIDIIKNENYSCSTSD
jgi:molybdopterin/thiamine biosynthesis adenylyltransferase